MQTVAVHFSYLLVDNNLVHWCSSWSDHLPQNCCLFLMFVLCGSSRLPQIHVSSLKKFQSELFECGHN